MRLPSRLSIVKNNTLGQIKWDRALATPGPVIIEALVDPFEPPMPAKATLDQAAHFAKALLRGEPNRERIALTVLSDKVRELI